MGFSEGFSSAFGTTFNAGIQAENIKLKRQQVRNETAKTNAQLMDAGYNYDPKTGNLEITDEHKQALKTQQDLAIQQAQVAQQSANTAYNAILAQRSANVFSHAANSGNWDLFNKFINKNPKLKELYTNVLGVTGIHPIQGLDNANTPQYKAVVKYFTPEIGKEVGDINGDKKVDANDFIQKLKTDDNYRQAFLKSHFLIQDINGNYRVSNVDEANKTLGFWKDMAATDYKSITQTYDQFVQTTKGVFEKTQSELKLNEEKVETEKDKQLKYKADVAVDQARINNLIASTQLSKARELNAKLDKVLKQYKIDDEKAIDTVQANINTLSQKVLQKPDDLTKDPKTLAMLKQYSDTIGYKQIDAKTKTVLSSADNFMSSGTKLLKQVNKDDFDMDAYQKIKTDVLKYLDTENPEKRKELLQHIKVQTGMGMLLSQFLLDTSGMAVTDEEYKRKLKIVFASDYANKDALVSALDSAIHYQSDVLNNTLKKVAKVDPYTAWVYKSKLDNSTSQSTKTKPKLDDFWKGEGK